MPAQLSARHLFMRRCALTPLLVTVCLFLWFVRIPTTLVRFLLRVYVYLITSHQYKQASHFCLSVYKVNTHTLRPP